MKPTTIATYLAGERAREEIERVLYRIWDEVMKHGAQAVIATFPKHTYIPDSDGSLSDTCFESFELNLDTVALKTSSHYGDETEYNTFYLPRHIIESDDPMAAAQAWAIPYLDGLKTRIQAKIDQTASAERARDLAHFEMLKKRFSDGNLGEIKP